MRAVLVVSVLTLALTSCTGSPSAQKTPGPSPPVSSSTPQPTRDTTPVSLPCNRGAQKLVVVGAEHKIEGTLAGRPLMSPPARDHNNKILWAAKQAGRDDLMVSASLNGTDLQVQRRVDGGPGPSIINVPRAGCWTFSLTWGSHHDVVAVRYDPLH